MIQEILKQEQPYVYQIFKNAFGQGKLAHAYMFIGDSSSKKKECAYLIAQSLVCEQEGYADETCDRCLRVSNGNYADMIYLNGIETSIKKEDIIRLKEEFSKTNLEEFGKKIYIINGAEHATPSALNSLLTFLEEPKTEAIAILLVEQPEFILDTIKSRCQMIQFKNKNKESSFVSLKETLDVFDAYLISHLDIPFEEASEVAESEEYQHALYIFKGYIDRLQQNNLMAGIFLQKDGFGGKKQNHKVVLNYLLGMLHLLGRDILLQQRVEDQWYIKQIDTLTKIQAEKLIQVSNYIRDKNVKSVNMNLLIDQLLYEMGDLDEQR